MVTTELLCLWLFC